MSRNKKSNKRPRATVRITPEEGMAIVRLIFATKTTPQMWEIVPEAVKVSLNSALFRLLYDPDIAACGKTGQL